MAIILGIDPWLSCHGIWRNSPTRATQLIYLGSGCIRTQVPDSPSRLKRIYAGVSEIITQFSPDVFSVEQVFMAKKCRLGIKIRPSKRCVAILAAVNNDLPVFEYAARQVKQSVVGTGEPIKAKYNIWYAQSLNYSSAAPQADAADALAIAITHRHFNQNLLRVGDPRLVLTRGRLR